MRRFPLTLRARLTLWFSATLALLVLLSGMLMYWIVSHRLSQHHDGMLLDKAAQVQFILKDQEDCAVLSSEQLAAMDHLGQIALLHEFNGQHQVYYASPEMKTSRLAPTVGAMGWQDAPAPALVTVDYRGANWRILSEPYQARSGRRGVIRLMEPLGEVQETLRHLRFAILLLIPVGVLCSAVGGYWLSGRALAPMDRIATRAREIEASRLDQRLPHPGVNDEVGRLVDTLNHMIGRLEGAFLAMRQFTADASHELRNPLATIRSTIDVLSEQPRSPGEHQAALEAIGMDVDRLSDIVEDLLFLARADHGHVILEREPVRLDRLALAMAGTYQAKAKELGVGLALDAPTPATVEGDERWLHQLVANLVDNALKFTPSGGAVQVAVLPGENGVRLSVRDTGPGIPEESLERVFDRFYQVDPSRTRTQKSGSGLGLAIAAWIVAEHGGRITAANHPEGGAVFTVELPFRSPPLKVMTTGCVNTKARDNPGMED
jgi:heavy metal sensor kinase